MVNALVLLFYLSATLSDHRKQLIRMDIPGHGYCQFVPGNLVHRFSEPFVKISITHRLEIVVYRNIVIRRLILPDVMRAENVADLVGDGYTLILPDDKQVHLERFFAQGMFVTFEPPCFCLSRHRFRLNAAVLYQSAIIQLSCTSLHSFSLKDISHYFERAVH